MLKTTTVIAFLVLVLCGSTLRSEVTFEWALVGNAGNPSDEIYPQQNPNNLRFGAVDYDYRIGKYEVTNAQYTEFLNAAAATDSFGLYHLWMGSNTNGGITRNGNPGSYRYSVKAPAVGQGAGGTDYTYENKPVIMVSFFDAIRFVNWLHNGQGNGDTESGVYNISDGVSETRSANAKYWIPSEDEWYKAAYYDPNSGVYYDYPTSTDSIPNNNRPTNDTGNSANIYASGNDDLYKLTDVGAYSLSKSPYGTYDQGGNVGEWNEAVLIRTDGNFRGLRGGTWGRNSLNTRASFRDFHCVQCADEYYGFRVATVPEPNTLLLAALGTLGLFLRRQPVRLSR